MGADEVAALSELGRSLAADSTPGDALFGWLRAFLSHVATKRELPLAIPDDTTGQRSELYQRWHDTMRATASSLLERAQATGYVGSDVDAGDLLAAASGIGHAAAGDEQTGRLLAIIPAGVTAQPAAGRNGSGAQAPQPDCWPPMRVPMIRWA